MAAIFHKPDPPRMISTHQLQTDVAGSLHRVTTDKQAIGIYPTVDYARGEVGTPIAYLIPSEEYTAFQAFQAFRNSVDALNQGPRFGGIVE